LGEPGNTQASNAEERGRFDSTLRAFAAAPYAGRCLRQWLKFSKESLTNGDRIMIGIVAAKPAARAQRVAIQQPHHQEA